MATSRDKTNDTPTRKQKAKFFATMDLTSGYHQAPVESDCTDITAFRAGEGIYEWLRLPMGLKGAPSFFQKTLSTQVLQGLEEICDVYLDDIIVFGTSEDDLIQNLSKVFNRFKQYNITLNPEKFGLHEVVFVGHTINESGHHFPRKELDEVKNFVKPTTQTGSQFTNNLMKDFVIIWGWRIISGIM